MYSEAECCCFTNTKIIGQVKFYTLDFCLIHLFVSCFIYPSAVTKCLKLLLKYNKGNKVN